MEVFWGIVLSAMLTVYVIMDGFDFGVGIIHFFLAKKEEDKKKLVGAIGPFWDGNEVWLIASGGILFFAFPTLYASTFSGFYLPLIMVLWLLIFRAIGLELRHQVNNEMWQLLWDKAFGLASLLLPLFFGIALGNVIRGVNLGAVENGEAELESSYFFNTLWADDFSPFNSHPGIIDWFTLTLGIIAVLAITLHGAAWIIFKTRSSLNNQLRRLIKKGGLLLLVFVVITVYMWTVVKPSALANFQEHYWLFLFPGLIIIALAGLIMSNERTKDGRYFLYTTLFIVGSMCSTVASLFPVMLHSTNTVNESLTVYNASATEYELSIGLSWWIFGIILVISYFVLVHRIFKGKTDDISYDH